MGLMPGLKAFVAAVVGGIGNIPGAVLGGLLIGVFETLVNGYISSVNGLKSLSLDSSLIVVLMIRPSGLLGKERGEKV
jgi:branched-chain amino acid transport system permease protein